MRLENPARDRRVAESVGGGERFNAVRRLFKLERIVQQQFQDDINTAEAIIRVLRSAAHERLADELRGLLQGKAK